MTDDAELICRFAEGSSQAAFAEIVQRHLPLVYAAALRQVAGDEALAQEVTQQVFTDLARKPEKLVHHPVLAGWLFTSTRYAARNAVRAEQRRRTREQEAYTMQELTRASAPADDWNQLRPVIDEALHALGQRDREAVLLRFFEGRPFTEIGERFSISGDAARRQVDRALEKMRRVLARNGVKSTGAALAVALASQPVVAVPLGLAAAVTETALASLSAHAALGATFMGITKLQLSIAGALALAGTTAFVFQAHASAKLQAELSGLNQENASLAALAADNALLATNASDVNALRADDTAFAGLQAATAALMPVSTSEPTKGKAPRIPRQVFDTEQLDVIPQPTSQVSPSYPTKLLGSGLKASVLVGLIVDDQGNVLGPKIVLPGNSLLDAAAIAAAKRWKFTPGQRNGQAVYSHLQVTIDVRQQ